MVPSFTRICNKIRELWKNEIENSQNNDNNKNVLGKKKAKIDIMSYMSKATLEVIGIVGEKIIRFFLQQCSYSTLRNSYVLSLF